MGKDVRPLADTSAKRDGCHMMKSTRLTQTERQLLDLVRRNPGITRSALTGHTLVSQQTVHRSLDALHGLGLLAFTEAVKNGRGKPSPGVTLVPDAIFSVGISVNTDAVMLSLVNLTCDQRAEVRVDTDPTEMRRCLLDVKAAYDDICHYHDAEADRVIGVGLAISGFKSGKEGHFTPPVPLSDWAHRDLHHVMASVFELPIWLENNATAGAIGEAMVGAGLAYETFAYLSFNYGFGCGLVSKGDVYLGGFGNAGEIGRIYRPDQIAHRPAMGELLERLRARGNHLETIGALNRHYDPSWSVLEEWLDEVTPQLELALRGLVAVFDPMAIVFGGEAPFDLRQRLIARCDIQQFDRLGVPVPGPQLLNSDVKSDPAAFGAALIPLKSEVLI